jgi:CBS domain-containing protein
MKVDELMSKPVATCSADDLLESAVRVFWQHDCGSVPVVDRSGVLIGILTDRDALIAAWSRGARLSELRVGDVMTKRVQVCWPDDSVDVAIELLVEQRVRRLPVVDAERKVVGMLSLCDVARAAAYDTRGSNRERWLARVGSTFAQITRRHGEPAVEDATLAPPIQHETAPMVPVGSTVH